MDALGHNAIALARCRVLYIGTALPTETSEGSEAVQKPLRERYNKDGKLEGIDSRLVVYTDGIQLQFIDDQKTVIWFPILSLHVCAAVKCVTILNAATGGQGNKFLPLDNINSDLKDVSPPIFAMITRRVRGIKILECHSFVCKSDAAAMALVQCCTHAYETKETDGGTLSDDGLSTTPMTAQEETGYKAWVSAAQYKEVPTTPGGYYIGEGGSLVKNYGIWTNSTTKFPTAQRAKTLGPSHLGGRGTFMGAQSPLPDGTIQRAPRVAYVPASMIRNVDARTGAGTIDANTLNKYLKQQNARVHVDQDDAKSFYMYPQDKPQISYWQANMPRTPRSPGASPDYNRPNSMFNYPAQQTWQKLPITPEYPAEAEPRLQPPPSPPTRDRSPSQSPRENGAPRSPEQRQQRPTWTPGLRHPDGRPVTPPVDYDIDEHFEGYWHGYTEQFAKPNLNDLMKKRASQVLDERVHEEIIFKNGRPQEPETTPNWKSGGKLFSNEKAFSRSIQMEMDARPGASKKSGSKSAYELMEERSKGEKPFDDLDSTLGYLP